MAKKVPWFHLIQRITWTGKYELSLGRNGSIKTSGVVVEAYQGIAPEDKCVDIHPLSKGIPAQCRISIPADPKVILQLAKQLERVAKELSKKKHEPSLGAVESSIST